MTELNIGHAVKEIRSLRRVSIYALAEKASISPSLVSKIENNKREPSLKTLRALHKALEVPFSVFISFSEKRDPNSEFFSLNEVIQDTLREAIDRWESK